MRRVSAAVAPSPSITGGVLGAAYLLRMVADSGTDLRWALWASPLGWVEELHPLTGSRPVMLVPIVAFTGVLAALTVHLAGVRDLGASTLAAPDSAPARTRLLGDSTGLALRLERPVALAWLAALAVLGLVEGLVAQGAASTLSGAATSSGRSAASEGGMAGSMPISVLPSSSPPC